MRKIKTGLYRLREKHGYTVEEMAKQLNLNVLVYKALEKEPKNLTLPYIIKLTDTFAIKVKDLE